MIGPLAITGFGCVTASGLGSNLLHDALTAKRSGLAIAGDHPLVLLHDHPAGVVRAALPPAPTRTSALASAAAHEACADNSIDLNTVGLAVGTCTGGMPESESAYIADRHHAHAIYRDQEHQRTTAHLARTLGLGGPQATHSVACASSACAAIEAIEWVRQGRCPAALVVGTDALCRVTVDGFHTLRLLDPQGCRPLSATRSGMSIGEGAAALLFEHPDHARARGATILGSILGWGLATDAHHATAPEPHGQWLANAIRAALSDANLTPDHIAYVNAHGTGTPDNDPAELAAIQQFCAADIPVASSKGVTGHCMGAAAAIEAVVALLAIQQQCAFASVNVDQPLATNVISDHQTLTNDVVLSTTLAFGGVNAALLIGGPARCG